jgi:hypothetical protein
MKKSISWAGRTSVAARFAAFHYRTEYHVVWQIVESVLIERHRFITLGRRMLSSVQMEPIL